MTWAFSTAQDLEPRHGTAKHLETQKEADFIHSGADRQQLLGQSAFLRDAEPETREARK